MGKTSPADRPTTDSTSDEAANRSDSEYRRFPRHADTPETREQIIVDSKT